MKKSYVVFDQRNGFYAVGCSADEPGIDFVIHLGGFSKEGALSLRDTMNAEETGVPAHPITRPRHD